MTEPRRDRGRPPKYPPEEVRHRLLSSATNEILHHGLGFGVDKATLETAIDTAEVPRGVSYKLWRESAVDDESPQDSLRHAVIAAIACNSPDDWIPASRTFFEEEAAKFHRGETTPQQIFRAVGIFAHRLISESLEIRLVQAFTATAATQPNTPPAIANALTQGRSKVLAGYNKLIADFASEVGARARPGRSIEEFTEALGTVVRGISQGPATGSTPQIIERPTGVDGEAQEWTVAGICIEALAHQHFDWSTQAAG